MRRIEGRRKWGEDRGERGKGEKGKRGKGLRKEHFFSFIWNKRDYSNLLGALRFAVLLMGPFVLTNHKLRSNEPMRNFVVQNSML